MGILNIEKNGVGFFTDAQEDALTIAENVPFRGVFPVGAIYLTTDDTMNPSTYFGGTWQQIAQGRILVGIDEDDSSFNTPSKTGGEYTHGLTTNQMPSHRHQFGNMDNRVTTGGTNPKPLAFNDENNGYVTSTIGSGTKHQNCMPSIACKIWQCTAMYN